MSSSLLLSLSSKLSLPKLALRSNTLRTFSTTTNPYLMFVVASHGTEEFPKAGTMTQHWIYDPIKEEYFAVYDKPYPKEMVNSRLVGSSNGWGLFLTPSRNILLTDFCNPSSSKTNPKFISMIPRTKLKGCQTELVSSMAMSSSSPDHEDCTIVVNYSGRLVSIETTGKDTGSVFFTRPKLFDYCEHTKLMYSKKDQCFYMPSDGGHHLWSLDATQSKKPQFHELRFHNLPQFSQSELQLLDACTRTTQLVESPSGQRFLVKWYAQSLVSKSIPFDCGGTKRFMVFREEEDMNFSYTEDIGDLCIFLGDNNEPFCVKASTSPGLKPNYIYYSGEGFGLYDIATRTPLTFNVKNTISTSSDSDICLCHWLPHWIPPSPL